MTEFEPLAAAWVSSVFVAPITDGSIVEMQVGAESRIA